MRYKRLLSNLLNIWSTTKNIACIASILIVFFDIQIMYIARPCHFLLVRLDWGDLVWYDACSKLFCSCVDVDVELWRLVGDSPGLGNSLAAAWDSLFIVCLPKLRINCLLLVLAVFFVKSTRLLLRLFRCYQWRLCGQNSSHSYLPPFKL